MTTDSPECDVNGWCDLPGGHRGECRSATDQTIEGPGVVPSDGGEAPVTTRPVPTLARLRALEAAATPGPWERTTRGYANRASQVGAIRRNLDGTSRRLGLPKGSMTDMTWVGAADAEVALVGNGPKQTQNGELIAAARNALPMLLAVAEAARDVLGWFDGHDGPDVGRAVEARLRAALRALEDQP